MHTEYPITRFGEQDERRLESRNRSDTFLPVKMSRRNIISWATIRRRRRRRRFCEISLRIWISKFYTFKWITKEDQLDSLRHRNTEDIRNFDHENRDDIRLLQRKLFLFVKYFSSSRRYLECASVYFLFTQLFILIIRASVKLCIQTYPLVTIPKTDGYNRIPVHCIRQIKL